MRIRRLNLLLLALTFLFCPLTVESKQSQPRKKRNITRRIRVQKPADKRRHFANKALRDQTIDELEANYQLYLKLKYPELCIKYLEYLIPKLLDFVKICNYRLQLSDLYFQIERYAKAGSLYTEYYEAYPASESAEYALWRAILSKWKQMGACDQDSSATKEVLDLSKQYLDNQVFQKYRAEIADLSSKCDRELLNSEIVVFEHYFKQGFLKSAERRLEHLKKLRDKSVHLKPDLDVLEKLLAEARKGKSPIKLLRGNNILDLVWGKKKQKKPECEPLIRFGAKKSYVDRF